MMVSLFTPTTTLNRLKTKVQVLVKVIAIKTYSNTSGGCFIARIAQFTIIIEIMASSKYLLQWSR